MPYWKTTSPPRNGSWIWGAYFDTAGDHDAVMIRWVIDGWVDDNGDLLRDGPDAWRPVEA